jgi:hypothetical protein
MRDIPSPECPSWVLSSAKKRHTLQFAIPHANFEPSESQLREGNSIPTSSDALSHPADDYDRVKNKMFIWLVGRFPVLVDSSTLASMIQL